ncbi:tumor necrosis factor receptor superfamily member 27 isoform X2 [Neoarius graeffei]|uniref:tumor necrosis factor receptor superfamily member 27 isoform X2 n=1 Tax=Neoarius graeffei TaxID=443677 RepID=UPI00298C5468|nr:tumor necrosis factor receptor superfamily member 27 isoform X2 [Neoarius graeffei]
MACAEDEFSLHGECRRCPRCPPGYELKQDCGYGVGSASVCGVCDQRWFKEDWGSHLCRMCQNCGRLNRQELTPCTHTHNAVCGDCLFGFYSKRRLDGLQDLECLPCGSAHIKHTQCETKYTTVKAWSSEATPLNAATMTTACVMAVAVATILLIIMALTFRRFNTLWKTFKEFTATSLPAGHSTLSDITSCRVVTQVTGSHDGASGWAGHGPVECTEREILHGEKRMGTSDVSRGTENTSTSLQGVCLRSLSHQEHPPGADATANTANNAC